MSMISLNKIVLLLWSLLLSASQIIFFFCSFASLVCDLRHLFAAVWVDDGRLSGLHCLAVSSLISKLTLSL